MDFYVYRYRERKETSLSLYAGWSEYPGFLSNDAGYITGCTDGQKIAASEGFVILPRGESVVGLEAGCFAGLEDVVTEIFIPANIREIKAGAIDCLPNLFYIEVDAANPVYKSQFGCLYAKDSGELILTPMAQQDISP